jgi:mono/diheme cytochrome c family protein
MRYLLTIAVVLFVSVIGAILYAWSGVYNIAATEPHWAVTLAFIDTLRDRSIEAHGDEVRVPDLNDPTYEKVGFPHYHEMCRLCHGAPKYAPEEFAEGLYPIPPKMTSGHIQEELSDAEIYWIVKHGLKMTGMPAFGPTHNEEQLWGLVSLVREMPRMTPEQYRQQVGEFDSEREAGHGHGEPSTHGKAAREHH